MAMYKPQRKHRAKHCNYKKKPSQKSVKALMDLYAGIIPIKEVGVQLKLEL